MAKFEVGSQDEDLPRTVIGVESSSPVQGGRGNGSAFRRQLSAAVVFVSFNLMYGIAITYTSIAVPSWNEDPKTPFNLTENDAGLHGSIVNVGALAGGLLGGILVTWLGNKWQLILSQIPLTISWLLLAYPPSKFVMMMGRVLTGIAVEVHMVSATMYLSDIAAPKNRGRLTSLTQIAMNIGNILVYATGLFLDWRQTAFLFGAIPILIAAFAMNFPESPSYLLSKGREDKALHSLAWYRGQSNEYSQDEKHLAPILAEFEELKISVAHSTLEQRTESVGLWKAMTTTIYRRPIMIMCACCILRSWTGLFAIYTFAVDIFREAGSNIDGRYGGIIVTSCLIGSQIISGTFADKWGRKIPTLFSLCFCGLSQAAFGVYQYLKMKRPEEMESLAIMPLICLMSFMLSFGMGTHNLSFGVTVEIIPGRIRKLGTTIFAMVNNLGAFTVVATYYPLSSSFIGLHGTFWIYALCSFVLLALYAICVPEGKGLSLLQIERKMSEPHLKKKQLSSKDLLSTQGLVLDVKNLAFQPDLSSSNLPSLVGSAA